MTLRRLIKLLQALEEDRGNIKVVVDKESLWDGNRTFTMCDIKSARVEWVHQCDGDGFTVTNKDGTERGKHCVVLSGEKARNQNE